MKPRLTLEILKTEARTFAGIESVHQEPSLYGVTDGKAVGTYFEHKFRSYLREWRLQYSRVIEKAGSVVGIEKLR